LYKKAGIVLMEIQPASMRQQLLFKEEDPKSAKVKLAMDALNGEYDRNTVCLALSGIQKRWAAKFETRTPHYTTNWAELLTAKAS